MNDIKPKILYVAPAEVVPGSVGGSVHVEEVTRGLARLGYDVHTLLRRSPGLPSEEKLEEGATLYRYVPDYKPRMLLFRAYKLAAKLASEIQPDYIIERYYNFGGAGVRTAVKTGTPVMLEVNSPVIDHPGSLKKLIDTLLIFRPMKKYREWMCEKATDIITPLEDIIPPVEESKVHRITWGAAVERFEKNPDRELYKKNLGIKQDDFLFVFIGAFRRWHGVWDLVKAVKLLQAEESAKFKLMLIGDGPERRGLKEYVKENGISDTVIFTGSVEYDRVPQFLLAADAGIAPYNPALHKQLSLGFYWSPLKIFEYMAASLPTITINLPPLNSIIENSGEGWLYPAGNKKALAKTMLLALNSDEKKRSSIGLSARKKVENSYSWKKHCEDLDKIIRRTI